MEEIYRITQCRKKIDSNNLKNWELERRIRGVNKIISNINSKFDNNVTNINNAIDKASNYLEGGIRGISNGKSVAKLKQAKQKGDGYDGKISEAKQLLHKEVNRCNKEIYNNNMDSTRMKNDIDFIIRNSTGK